MYEKEERMLKSYFQDAEESAASIPEEKLEAAVQEGIRRGKRAKRSYLRYRGAALFAGAVAVVLLLVWGGSLQQTGEVEHMAAGPYPPLKGHNFEGDITLNTANNHGMIQPVDKSVTKGDYTVTVDGVLVGSHQLKVLYTLENRSDRKAIVMGTNLENKDGKSPISYGSSSHGTNEFDSGTHRLQVEYTFDDADQMSKDMNIVFRVAPDSANARAGRNDDVKGEEKLEVGITLDLEAYQKYIRTVMLDEVVEIQGQKMRLQEITYSPAGIVLKGNVDIGNNMRVSGLWNVYLDSTKNGESTQLMSPMNFGPDEKGDMTYFFNSNLLDEIDSLILKADGLYAVDPDKMKVVVDTEQKIVLSAPDDNIKFGSYTDSKEGHTLTLVYEESDEQHRGSVSISNEFIDGKGNKHKMDDSSQGVRSTSTSNETGGRKTTDYLYLKPEEYPQPLTFSFDSYPGVIEKSIEVPLVMDSKEADAEALKSSILSSIPKPEGAVQAGIRTNSGNPNIKIEVRYELENIGGEQGLYSPTEYFQQLQAAGWAEIEEERMGHVHFFEKEDAVIAIEVREDWIDIYEMEEGQFSN
ncbi:DUF4179 domain-containing protein [Paenibacillus sp. GCM10028914]|uniref:DUF4179 domain-containing protein n=1 Tax=Paenibacillus sp. GCM10028914 TaxID=3273416 RepID=UPI003614959A